MSLLTLLKNPQKNKKLAWALLGGIEETTAISFENVYGKNLMYIWFMSPYFTWVLFYESDQQPLQAKIIL